MIQVPRSTFAVAIRWVARKVGSPACIYLQLPPCKDYFRPRREKATEIRRLQRAACSECPAIKKEAQIAVNVPGICICKDRSDRGWREPKPRYITDVATVRGRITRRQFSGVERGTVAAAEPVAGAGIGGLIAHCVHRYDAQREQRGRCTGHPSQARIEHSTSSTHSDRYGVGLLPARHTHWHPRALRSGRRVARAAGAAHVRAY